MDSTTAATLLLIFTAPDGGQRTEVYKQPSVSVCETNAAKMLQQPRHRGAPYAVRHECWPHYRFAD
jgi:hypothetical protein